MATYIYVNQASDLLKRNQAELEANRRRQAARQRSEADDRQKAAAAATPQQATYGIRRRGSTAEEPAASGVLIPPNRLAYAWVASIGLPYDKLMWQITSVDLSTQVAGEVEDTGEVPGGTAWLGLPVQGNTCIAVMLGRIENFIVANATGRAVNRAFLCSPSTIREINIPTKLAEVITPLNPEYPNANYDEQYPGDLNTNPYPPRQISGLTGEWYDPKVGLVGTGFDLAWSPVIYEFLNRITPYATQSEFIPYESRLGYLTYFLRQDGNDGYAAGRWYGNPSQYQVEEDYAANPLLFSEFPSAYTRIPVDADLPPRIIDPNFPDAVGDPSLFLVTWDWGNPAYCKRMLRKLGFSNADLVP